VGEQRLEHQVKGTGAWENYRQTQIGTLKLDAGNQVLTARSAGTIRSALIDLRGLRLVPIEK
jgi:hypothetical protein